MGKVLVIARQLQLKGHIEVIMKHMKKKENIILISNKDNFIKLKQLIKIGNILYMLVYFSKNLVSPKRWKKNAYRVYHKSFTHWPFWYQSIRKTYIGYFNGLKRR